MTEWRTAIAAALAGIGLTAAAVGLIAYIRLIDRFRVNVGTWIGDLTQGGIVLVATLLFLALAFVSGEPYAYVAAAATAGAEGVTIWFLWLISRLREVPASSSGYAKRASGERLPPAPARR